MRTVGRRVERPISFHASGELLREGALFNDEIHRLPGGGQTCIPKGVRRFKDFDEKNREDLECVVANVVRVVRERALEKLRREQAS
jgi:hypothetical protein